MSFARTIEVLSSCTASPSVFLLAHFWIPSRNTPHEEDKFLQRSLGDPWGLTLARKWSKLGDKILCSERG